METMSNETDRYNGYANRETWAFNLHWQNDQGLYNDTLEEARRYLASVNDAAGDYELGQNAVGYWYELIFEWRENMGTDLPEGLAMFRDEVGSWWRIDYAEVGAAVRESLGIESGDESAGHDSSVSFAPELDTGVES